MGGGTGTGGTSCREVRREVNVGWNSIRKLTSVAVVATVTAVGVCCGECVCVCVCVCVCISACHRGSRLMKLHR